MSIEPIPLEAVESKLPDQLKDQIAVAAHDSNSNFVEGGLQGWLNVLGATMNLFATFGYVNSFGVYQSYYQANTLSHKSPSDIAWIGSTAMFIEFGLAFPVGAAFDRGYFRACLLSGSILFTFSIFMVSLAETYWQIFLCQSVAFGIGMGLVFMPSISSLHHFFRRKAAFVMGIAMAGSSLGGICFPIMLNRLFLQIGFAQAVRASGFIVLGLLLIANLIMRTRYPPKIAGPKRKAPSPKSLLSEPRYTLATIGTTLYCLGVFYPINFIQVFAETAGLPLAISNNVLAILNAASFIGRILPNLAADTLGCFNTLLVTAGGVTILIFALYGATSPAAVIIFALLYGFFSGGVVSLLSPMLISTARDPSEIGMRQGVSYFFNSFAALTSSPIAGALLDAGGGDFKYSTAFAGGVSALGCLCMLVARIYQKREIGTWKV